MYMCVQPMAVTFLSDLSLTAGGLCSSQPLLQLLSGPGSGASTSPERTDEAAAEPGDLLVPWGL